MLGRRLNPTRFLTLLEEFRQKITRERITARLTEIKQTEVIELVKLQAEMKARYLLAVLELAHPKASDIEDKVHDARRFREMLTEIDAGVKFILDGLAAKEIAIDEIDHAPDVPDDIEKALDEFVRNNPSDWRGFKS